MSKRKNDDDDFLCNHDRAGIVTNQPDEYDHNTTCRAQGLAWVWKKTGEQGIYISDASRKLRRS